MIKKLILLCVFAYSSQIPNCAETMQICKSCIEGYTFIDSGDRYRNKCIKNEIAFLGDPNDNCLLYTNSDKTECEICKKGFWNDHSQNVGQCVRLPEHCDYFWKGRCSSCESYYNLTDDGKCERINCMEIREGECHCNEGFYPYENKMCKKIPIKNCEEYDGTKCTECNEGYKQKGNECIYVGFEEEEEEEKINIDNCWSLDSKDKSKCSQCYRNYEWNDDKKQCEYLCVETEELCGDCDDNYHTFDNGKTCEIIDPDYKEIDDEEENKDDSKETDHEEENKDNSKETDKKNEGKNINKNDTNLAKDTEKEENLANLINFDLVALASLLFLII